MKIRSLVALTGLTRITVAAIFALTFYALLLANHFCAATASAETQSVEQEQAEKTAVDHALRDYSDAFGRGDLSAIGQHCNVPFVAFIYSPQGSQGVKVLPTMPEIEAFYGGVLRPLRERGYSHRMVQVARSGEAQKAFLGSSRLWSTRYEVARALIYRGKSRLKEFGNSHAITD